MPKTPLSFKTIDVPTAALMGLLALGWLGTLGAAAAPQLWLERGHLKHGFVVFAATQFVPFMYTADNRRILTFSEPPAPQFAEDCDHAADVRRNHVMIAALLMPQYRNVFVLCSPEAEVALQSSWNGWSASSRWRIRPDGRGYVVEPL